MKINDNELKEKINVKKKLYYILGMARGSKSSIYTGVSFHKGTNKWEAYIYIKDKKHYVGRFEDEEAAARAHDTYAKRCECQN